MILTKYFYTFNLLLLLFYCCYLGYEQSFHRWLAPTLKELKRRKNNLGPDKPVHRKTFIEW